MSIVYHITTQAEWEVAKQQGYYKAASLATEGFIHCSKAEQVAGVLNRYFTNKTNLLRLTIDTSFLTSKLVYEKLPLSKKNSLTYMELLIWML